ncbi:metallophosphoesterase family protein [Sulfurimonas lithotrophica]|uniref:Phosphoesterase n=1 Tax=Sulfurimonas lithotrophica TaxID=2590022 RepID=A0A5P8NY20_9BACT|nr:YfcE family phosphodiesterase [Sulfurimonas lithotrophica]QFR48335.1 metallophosphoesterase family protein [Sulfurimonas lithotrophica]
MKIGVISDTHSKVGKAKKVIEFLLREGAEFFIHAGDIVEVEVLDLLEQSGKKYVAVYGNNDAHLAEYHNKYNLVQEPNYFKLSNLKFKLMHLPFYMTPDADVVISGHTHTFHSEYKGDTLFLNPGEVCARSKPISECAMLDVKEHNLIVTHFTRESKTEEFIPKVINYAR